MVKALAEQAAGNLNSGPDALGSPPLWNMVYVNGLVILLYGLILYYQSIH